MAGESEAVDLNLSFGDTDVNIYVDNKFDIREDT
jgi:hypothetical protein